jgi:hypothetical protein
MQDEDASVISTEQIAKERTRTDKWSRGAEDKTADGMTLPTPIVGEAPVKTPPVRMETGDDGQARARDWNSRGGPEKSSGQPTAPKGKAYAPGTHETAGK